MIDPTTAQVPRARKRHTWARMARALDALRRDHDRRTAWRPWTTRCRHVWRVCGYGGPAAGPCHRGPSEALPWAWCSRSDWTMAQLHGTPRWQVGAGRCSRGAARCGRVSVSGTQLVLPGVAL